MSDAAAWGGGVVVAACLRNARAVAAWLSERSGADDGPVTVIAAGERWPDGSLRPAQDLLGAGAVVAALAQRRGVRVSPEAAAAGAVHGATVSVPGLTTTTTTRPVS